MKEFLLYLWQLPQNLLGLIVLLFCFNKKLYCKKEGRNIYIDPKFGGGISLGNYLIVKRNEDKAIRHEYGHSFQSRYLGPLYLIIIGLPSIIGAIVDDVFHSKWTIEQSMRWYYNLPWEKWADKLGGVNRWEN